MCIDGDEWVNLRMKSDAVRSVDVPSSAVRGGWHLKQAEGSIRPLPFLADSIMSPTEEFLGRHAFVDAENVAGCAEEV